MKNRWKSFLSAAFWICVQALSVLLLLLVALWSFADIIFTGGWNEA